MFKKILLATLILLIGLGTTIVYNAYQLESKQISVEQIDRKKIIIPAKALDHFVKAIKIKTISYDKKEKIDYTAFEALHQHIKASYPLVDSLLKKQTFSKYSLLYTWEGTDPKADPVLLMAHQDVVPIEPGTENEWKQPAFDGKIVEGYVWGRGTLDDKNNLISILESCEMLLKQGFKPKRTIYFCFGHDEEISGNDGAKKIAEYFKEKGIKFHFILDEGLYALPGMVPGIEQSIPVAFVGISEKGYVNIEISVKYPGGHSSMPSQETAIGILSKAIVNLENNPFPSQIDGAVSTMFEYVSPEMDFGYKLLFGNRWLTNALIIQQLSQSNSSAALMRTTIAPTMMKGSPKSNVLPSKASIIVNFRIKPGETSETVLAHVKKVINDERVEVTFSTDESQPNDPSPISDINSEGFKTLHKTLKQLFPNYLVAPTLVLGGTDAKHFDQLSTSVFRFSPAKITEEEVKGIHATNERISVENFEDTIRFYFQLMKNMNE